MEFQKKRVATDAEEDRLSSLPNNLIDSILERVPICDAARTCILSTKWRCFWTKLPILIFDEHFYKNLKNGTFCRIVNRVLLHHNGPIFKFYIHVPERHFDMYEDICQWMSFLSRHDVKELTVISPLIQRYGLPSHVFSCSQLTMLRVENFIFKAPATFEGFSNLKTLCIRVVHFRLNPSRTVGTFPNLQDLTLVMCIGVNNFQINATKLSRLCIVDCQDAMFPLLVKNQYITRATIALSRPVQPSEQKIDLGKLLFNLKNIRFLHIGCQLLKSFAERIPDRLPNEVTHLNDVRLSIFQFSDLDHVRFTLCLLRSSPNLKRLTIDQAQHLVIVEHDKDQTISLLEEPNCLEQLLSQLDTISLKGIVGLRTELLFIKLILAHSPSLKSLSIRPSKTPEAEIRFRIVKDVMRLPRASPKAEIIYLDP